MFFVNLSTNTLIAHQRFYKMHIKAETKESNRQNLERLLTLCEEELKKR